MFFFSLPVVAEAQFDAKEGSLVEAWVDIVAESRNKKTLLASRELIDFIEQHRYRSGKSSVGFLNQKVYGSLITFAMAPFDPFFEEFDEKIQIFVESGMYSMLAYEFKGNNLYNAEVPPLVLTMHDLGIGFFVCLASLLLSMAVLLLEITIPKVRSLARRIRDSFVAVYLVVVSVKISVAKKFQL